jgi:hypothetical protein
MLGRGRGLTPSGDDLAVGLLLVLNRWPEAVPSISDLSYLNQRLVEAAGQQTTSLSRSLIQCAISGNSDERLLWVVDSIFTGEPEESESLSYLLQWGAS